MTDFESLTWTSQSAHTRWRMKTDPLVESITEGIAECAVGGIVHRSWLSLLQTLDFIWNPPPVEEDLRPTEPVVLLEGDFMQDHRRSPRVAPAPRFPDANQRSEKRPPPWYIGMSSDFTKSVSRIDRKLQGRVLEAITKITQEPTVAHGDTIKPLTGQLQGCWRYRLGDHRLIYSPDQSTGNITLLSFAPRGSVYVD